MFRFVAFKDTGVNGENFDAQAYNLDILREGVVGVECLEVRYVKHGEALDYGHYIPWGCHFGCCEVYANGAVNMHVHDRNDKAVGVLVRRPLTNQ